jgi:hypothetical protein
MHYVLGEMDEPQRAAFEDKLARFPSARAAVIDCGESLAALRRQAVEVPFFGDVVHAQIGLVMRTAQQALRDRLSRPWTQFRQVFHAHE